MCVLITYLSICLLMHMLLIIRCLFQGCHFLKVHHTVIAQYSHRYSELKLIQQFLNSKLTAISLKYHNIAVSKSVLVQSFDHLYILWNSPSNVPFCSKLCKTTSMTSSENNKYKNMIGLRLYKTLYISLNACFQQQYCRSRKQTLV